MNEVRVGSSKVLVTATEETRRLLDERGVEWSATVGAIGTIWTHWDAFNGQRIHAMDNDDGTVEIFDQWNLTPEQAIAATLGNEGVARSNDGVAELGAGTCHETMIDRFFRGCSECGYMWEYMYGIGRCQRPNYCPNCGRKVVDDG